MKPIETVHLVAQYLAAAAISFLEPKADDSHTNLGFTGGEIETHPLNDAGLKLVFSYAEFALRWKGAPSEFSLALKGKTHEQIVDWLRSTSEQLGFDKLYSYSFHYDLPYSISPEKNFPELTREELLTLSGKRQVANSVSEQFAHHLGVDVDIRIWPHHFDTGGYAVLENGIGVGWGMAIPDSVVDGMYFYISYYKDGSSYLPKELTELSQGHWKREGFVGAVLPLEGATTDPLGFFTEVHGRVV